MLSRMRLVGGFKIKRKNWLKHRMNIIKCLKMHKKIEIQLTSKVGIALKKLIKHRQSIREQLKSVNKSLDDALEKVSFYHIQEPTIHNIKEFMDIDDDNKDEQK
eukprot:TRINITY_DN23413_c0_g1_i1.p1 TRINITY_DN23413_c0_g1~~TRINITY_DN23413_c0_g1_i1.p1  ORF type:complete len:104 (+),score=4.85 TRINITY_DN23413_c0_g1_i1:108-419(+)